MPARWRIHVTMDGDQHPELVALRAAREATIEQLSACFAQDQLSLEDFEERVDRAYACCDEAALRALLGDLRPPEPALLATASARELLRVAAGPPQPSAPLARAVFGSVERCARGRIESGALVLSVFGNVELDLRDLHFPPGLTELRVRAVFGNVEITLPPTVAVECHGTPIFGSFASVSRLPARPSEEAVLRVAGSAVFGNVELKTLPRRALLEASPAGASRVRSR